MKRLVGILVAIGWITMAQAQDTLPDFKVVERGNRIFISWVNPFETTIQLNVQRSYDSVKYYRTIYSANSPALPQNGFTEPKQPNTKTYYRIFYVLSGGAYFFTPAKQAVADTEVRAVNLPDKPAAPTRVYTVRQRDGHVDLLVGNAFEKFRDSILRQTKDTLFAVNDSTVMLRRFIPKEVWRPSVYVYTNKEGYLNILLPDAGEKKYRLKFFEENGTPLFEIKQVKERMLTLDKSNFIHAGWFNFELYEDERLKEKNKFYLPKDF